jgi:hypothetical protein
MIGVAVVEMKGAMQRSLNGWGPAQPPFDPRPRQRDGGRRFPRALRTRTRSHR